MGGGSAGAVVAARLSEDPSVTVLLIEAGGESDNFTHSLPVAAPILQVSYLRLVFFFFFFFFFFLFLFFFGFEFVNCCVELHVGLASCCGPVYVGQRTHVDWMYRTEPLEHTGFGLNDRKVGAVRVWMPACLYAAPTSRLLAFPRTRNPTTCLPPCAYELSECMATRQGPWRELSAELHGIRAWESWGL